MTGSSVHSSVHKLYYTVSLMVLSPFNFHTQTQHLSRLISSLTGHTHAHTHTQRARARAHTHTRTQHNTHHALARTHTEFRFFWREKGERERESFIHIKHKRSVSDNQKASCPSLTSELTLLYHFSVIALCIMSR